MDRLFNEKELEELPVLFQFLEKEKYFINKQVLKQMASPFHQNIRKQKIRILHKQISKLYGDEDVC